MSEYEHQLGLEAEEEMLIMRKKIETDNEVDTLKDLVDNS